MKYLLISCLILLGCKSENVELYAQDSASTARYIDTTTRSNLKTYYYMWNYTDEHSDAWGENEIDLSFKPTEKYIKQLVWKSILCSGKCRGEYGKEYKLLEVVGIEEKSNDKNTLQNLPDKGELNYQRSMYRKLNAK